MLLISHNGSRVLAHFHSCRKVSTQCMHTVSKRVLFASLLGGCEGLRAAEGDRTADRAERGGDRLHHRRRGQRP